MTATERKAFESAVRAMEAKLAEYRSRVVACETGVKLLNEMLEESNASSPSPSRRKPAVPYEQTKAQLGLEPAPKPADDEEPEAAIAG